MKRKKSRHFAEEFLQNKKNLYICNPKRNKRFRNGKKDPSNGAVVQPG